MKEFKLKSFLYHPQLKSDHANAESAKLTNHDTSGTATTATPTSTSTATPTSTSTSTSTSMGSDIPVNVNASY